MGQLCEGSGCPFLFSASYVIENFNDKQSWPPDLRHCVWFAAWWPSSLAGPQHPRRSISAFEGQTLSLDGNHGNDLWPQQWLATSVTTALGKASVDFYRTLQWSLKMHRSVVLEHWTVGFCLFLNCSFARFLWDLCNGQSKQPLRIKSGSIYFWTYI